MEIYRNQPTTVTFRAPLPDGVYSIEVKSPRHTSLVQSVTPQHSVAHEGSVLNIPVDFQHTWYDGDIDFSITVQGGTPTTEHTYSEYATVVTPLFTWADLGSEYPQNATPELERLVRHVVEAYTGQYFGKRYEKVFASSHEQIVRFERPLIMLTDMSWEGRYAPLSTTLSPPKIPYETIDDGFSIVMNWDGYDVKTDSLWVIRNKCPRIVTLEGFFGYDRVPADVKEAAILIAGVWGCKQGVWRDRFIQIMRSADWSIQYNERVFASTGSATADQLLSKYRRTHLPEVF